MWEPDEATAVDCVAPLSVYVSIIDNTAVRALLFAYLSESAALMRGSYFGCTTC